MSEPDEVDAAFGEAVERVAGKLLAATNDEPVVAVQVALANVAAQLALRADDCDRAFLQTISGMFEVYRVASNHKLRNEDQAVS